MASNRNHSLLCEPSAGLFVVASLVTSLMLISAWTAVGIERRDGELLEANNDSNHRGGASETQVSGAAQSNPETAKLTRSQSLQATAALQILTLLHDTPR